MPSLGRSLWMFPHTNCLRFPSPSAQFVSCLFCQCSRAVGIPPHLLYYLRLPKLLPSLRFLSCYFRAVKPLRPTAPLRSRSIPKVSFKDKKNKLLTQLLRFLCGLIAASGSPSSASQSLIIGHLQTATAGTYFLLFPSRSSSTSFLLEVSERLWRTLLPPVSVSLNCRAASLWNRKRLEVLRGNGSWLFHSRRGSVSFL